VVELVQDALETTGQLVVLAVDNPMVVQVLQDMQAQQVKVIQVALLLVELESQQAAVEQVPQVEIQLQSFQAQAVLAYSLH
jgi:DNA-binding protein